MNGSLYERVGGAEGVSGFVEAFYDRVLVDPLLQPFFADAHLDKLMAMQQEFFSAALGGPLTYSGMSLRDAHLGRGIRPVHLTRFVEILEEVLVEHFGDRISRDDHDEIVSRITLAGADVLDDAPDVE